MTEACNSNVLHRDIIAIVCLVMSGTNGQDVIMDVFGPTKTAAATRHVLYGPLTLPPSDGTLESYSPN